MQRTDFPLSPLTCSLLQKAVFFFSFSTTLGILVSLLCPELQALEEKH